MEKVGVESAIKALAEYVARFTSSPCRVCGRGTGSGRRLEAALALGFKC